MTGLSVIGGGVVLLGLGIYGLLWAFGVFTSDTPDDAKSRLVDSNQESVLPRAIRDPMGAHPTNFQESAVASGAADDQTSAPPMPVDVGSTEGEDGRPRRNLIRESLEQQAGGGVSGPGSDALATNLGGQPPSDPEKSAPDQRPTQVPPPAVTRLSAMAKADDLLRENRAIEARQVLSESLADRATAPGDKVALRRRLAEMNADLVFSPKVVAGDTLSEVYEVQSGDSLARIAQRRELAVHWKLIQRVNGLSNPNQIRVGQKLKLLRGPFHVVVDKSEFRMDLYHGQPSAPEAWLYIRSFSVGLGKDDGTPVGNFVVMRGSKVEDPAWVNPHNPSERYASKDPKNPIGKFWVGIEGLGDSAGYVGYGIHGTIDPSSVGREESLGCVRLLPDDIALVYELLEDGISVVRIVP
jgi:LysM repeat protein